MIVIAFVLGALVLALIFGGDLRALADVKLRWWGLAMLAVAIQVAAFSSIWSRIGLGGLTSWIYIGSLGLLVVVAIRNWRLPGFALLAAGLVANALVIALNGGHMPVDPKLVQGAIDAGVTPGVGVIGAAAGSVLIDASTRLSFLCDIFLPPEWFPIRNAFSPGDVLIGLGAIWFFAATLRHRAPGPVVSDPKPPNA